MPLGFTENQPGYVVSGTVLLICLCQTDAHSFRYISVTIKQEPDILLDYGVYVVYP